MNTPSPQIVNTTLHRVIEWGTSNHCMAFHPRDNIWVSTTMRGQPFLTVWNEHGQETKQLAGYTNDIANVHWNSKGTLLATGGFEGEFIVWKYPSFQNIFSHTFANNHHRAIDVLWSSSDDAAVIKMHDRLVYIHFDIPQKMINILFTITIEKNHRVLCSWNPKQNRFCYIMYDESKGGILWVFDQSFRRKKSFIISIPTIQELKWVDDTSIIIRSSHRIVNINPITQNIEEYPAQSHMIWRNQGIAIDMKSEVLAYADNHNLIIRSVAQDNPIICESHKRDIAAIQWNRIGTMLATGSWDKTIKLWNSQGHLLATLTGHHDAILGLEWNHEGTRLLSHSRCYELFLWELDIR